MGVTVAGAGEAAGGGGAPVAVQSMTLTKTHDVTATTAQIAALASAGCEVVRVAVPKNEDAAALPMIVRLSPIPVIADIHFNASLALKAIEAGVAAVRINPGNIGGPEKVEQVVKAAKTAGIPMRIGANSGSLPRHLADLAQQGRDRHSGPILLRVPARRAVQRGAQPAGCLEEHRRARFPCQARQALRSIARLPREKAFEGEAIGRETRHRERCQDGAGAGDDFDVHTGPDTRSHQPFAGVGDRRHPGVGHVGHPPSLPDLIDDPRRHLRLVVLVNGQ